MSKSNTALVYLSKEAVAIFKEAKALNINRPQFVQLLVKKYGRQMLKDLKEIGFSERSNNAERQKETPAGEGAAQGAGETASVGDHNEAATEETE